MTETPCHDRVPIDDRSAATPVILHYARGRPRPLARPVALLFGLGGVVVNTYFVFEVACTVHWSTYAYHELKLDSRRYGRPISPDIIEMLRAPVYLWTASAAMLLAAAFGLLLALHLIWFAWNSWQSRASAPGIAAHYRRWKPVGTAITLIALLWFCDADLRFLIMATQHVPVGAAIILSR